MCAQQFVDRSRDMEERSWWDLWNTSYRSSDNADSISADLFSHVRNLLEHVCPVPGRMLEIACGTGTLSRQLPFAAYHGLDISPAAIDIAQEKSALVRWPVAQQPPTYEPADFHDWPLPADPFDVVLCVDALSCFRDQAAVMRKMSQALRPGGYVVLTSVNPFVYNRIRRAGGVKLENGPVSHWLKRSEFHELVAQAGLVRERSYTIMPRGNMGILRLINTRHLDTLAGPHGSAILKNWKEFAGLGQYRVIVARKRD